jgi:hypothetical protein
MITDVSSSALNERGKKFLLNIGNIYHLNNMLYLNTIQGGWIAVTSKVLVPQSNITSSPMPLLAWQQTVTVVTFTLSRCNTADQWDADLLRHLNIQCWISSWYSENAVSRIFILVWVEAQHKQFIIFTHSVTFNLVRLWSATNHYCTPVNRSWLMSPNTHWSHATYGITVIISYFNNYIWN